MATQTILPKDRHNATIQCVRPVVTQTVAFTNSGSTKAAAVLQPSTLVIRLFSTVDAFIEIGPDATVAAGVSSMPLGANTPEYFSIPAGDRGEWNVAARGISAGGTLYVTETA